MDQVPEGFRIGKVKIFLEVHKDFKKLLNKSNKTIFAILNGKIIDKKCSKEKGNCDFRMYGPGVEKIYEELKEKFPQKKIEIFSSDYLTKKKESKNI